MTTTERWGGPEAQQRHAVETEEIRASLPPAPPCPDWCTDPNGHPYSGLNAHGQYVRTHTHDISGSHYWVEQAEINQGGVITYGPLLICDESCNVVSPDKVRATAAAMLLTLEKFDEIRAVTR